MYTITFIQFNTIYYNYNLMIDTQLERSWPHGRGRE
jgi:hypothetical protein